MPERELQPLQVAETLGGIFLLGILIWDHFQPDGPREFVSSLGRNLRSLAEYHRAMKQTLSEIEDLPEVELEELMDDIDTTLETRNEGESQ